MFSKDYGDDIPIAELNLINAFINATRHILPALSPKDEADHEAIQTFLDEAGQEEVDEQLKDTDEG
jgi:hypothetical protein